MTLALPCLCDYRMASSTARVWRAARGVAIAPGPIFSARQQRFSACLRLSCGQPLTPRVATALDLIAHLAQDLAARGARAHRGSA